MSADSLSLFDAPSVTTPVPATPSPAERAAELRAILEAANLAYYRDSAPTMSDATYDALFRELQALEASDASLMTADSPTQMVGAPLAVDAGKVRHLAPMLSLGNAFSIDELDAWYATATRGLAGRAPSMIAELKIDGTSASLTYRHGVFTTGATRGNGEVGEDRTDNLRTVGDIPARVSDPRLPPVFEVRGEVYMGVAAFAQLNTERVAAGDAPFMNPRNAAAGAMNQKDAAEAAKRPLRFFAYAAVTPDGAPLAGVQTQEDLLLLLAELGFSVAPHRRLCTTIAEVHAWATEIETVTRGQLDFAIDGAVIKVNAFRDQADLGAVSRAPRWAIARKFAPDMAETRLLGIEVTTGRTGQLTPTAVLEPVLVGGVMVSSATLHNEDFVRDKDLRIGDMVQVYRAGDVIPKILGPVTGARTGTEEPWTMPTACPSCAAPVTRPEGEAAHYCTNTACSGRRLAALEHFASRDAMDIRGLSTARLSQMVDLAWVADVADLYDLTVDQVRTLDGMAERSAQQLVSAIRDSTTRPFARLLFGIGIRHVGETVAKTLARHFGSMDALAAATAADIEAVPGIGPEIATAVTTTLSDLTTWHIIARLGSAGFVMTEVREVRGTALAGQTVVITGTLPTLGRKEATALVEAHGGTVSGSVSKKTTFVLAGAEAGSKLDKAVSLGLPVLDEVAFLTRLET